MNKQSDWNPDLYLKFMDERTRPSDDLVNRIRIDFKPARILDAGCGPGNSSMVLLNRWPGAGLTGVDNSPAMIDKAKTDYPRQEWVLSDIYNFEPDEKFDIIFSNAAIQWIPDHKKLFEKLFTLLADNGIIAVQIPEFREMVLGRLIDSLSQRERWRAAMDGCADLFTYNNFSYYYDLLAGRMKTVDIWETDYIHVMDSHMSILEWIRSTGLKPYLDCIGDEKERKDFENEVLAEIKKHYPEQKDGKVLFPFKRLFFIGYRI